MNKIIRFVMPFSIALLALAGLFFVVDASAQAAGKGPGDLQAGILVTTLEDEVDIDGDCSLREALTAANTNAVVDTCMAGEAVLTDTVTFAVSGTITVTSQLEVAAGGPLVVDAGGVITTSGGGATLVWWVEPNSVVTLQGLGVVDGSSGYNGGGIHNDHGTIRVDNCTFKGNYSYVGGGISNYLGSLSVTQSAFISNTAQVIGGGIWNHGGHLSVSGSLFSDNLVAFGNYTEEGGGGINHTGNGHFSVDQSVFSNNRSKNVGAVARSTFMLIRMKKLF